nr:hypothetical protein [Eubacterium sp.]
SFGAGMAVYWNLTNFYLEGDTVRKEVIPSEGYSDPDEADRDGKAQITNLLDFNPVRNDQGEGNYSGLQ